MAAVKEKALFCRSARPTPLSNPYAIVPPSGSNLDAVRAHVWRLTKLKESNMSDFAFLAVGLVAFGAIAAYARLLARL